MNIFRSELKKHTYLFLAGAVITASLILPVCNASASTFPVLRATRNYYCVRVLHGSKWLKRSDFTKTEQQYINGRLNSSAKVSRQAVPKKRIIRRVRVRKTRNAQRVVRTAKPKAKRFSKHYRRYVRRENRNIQHIIKTSLARVSKMQSPQAQKIRFYTMKSINRDRISRGLPRVRITYGAQKLANERLPQVEQNHSHYDESGNTYIADDVASHHLAKYGPVNYGENIGDAYNADSQNNHNPTVYKNGSDAPYVTTEHGPRGMAQGLNNSYLYHDQSNGNAHEKNILNPQLVGMGVSADYNAHNGQSNIVEEFQAADTNSQNVNQNHTNTAY